MHQKLTDYGRCCMLNNQLQTKSQVELEDNTIDKAYIIRNLYMCDLHVEFEILLPVTWKCLQSY